MADYTTFLIKRQGCRQYFICAGVHIVGDVPGFVHSAVQPDLQAGFYGVVVHTDSPLPVDRLSMDKIPCNHAVIESIIADII
jgi:hypothetical protein